MVKAELADMVLHAVQLLLGELLETVRLREHHNHRRTTVLDEDVRLRRHECRIDI